MFKVSVLASKFLSHDCHIQTLAMWRVHFPQVPYAGYNIFFVNVIAWGIPCCHFTLFLCQGFLGISGAILIQVYGIFCKGKPSTFILMLALLPTFVSIVLMFFVRIHEANTVDDMKHLNGFPIIALMIATYLIIILSLENIFSQSSRGLIEGCGL